MEREWLERYRRDRDPHSFERLVEAYQPLVISVCRRHLSNPDDVEDAAQETMVKLLRHADAIHGSLSSWLHTAAHSTCMDMARRAIRERRRREGLAQNLEADHHRAWAREVSRRCLPEALGHLDEPNRQLLIDRFFRGVPLRVIAGREDVMASTISRRVSRAVAELGAVFRDMGFPTIDAPAERLAEMGRTYAFSDPGEQGLLHAPDWHAALHLDGHHEPALNLPAPSGWARPIRVGALISHQTTITPARGGVVFMIEEQIRTMRFLADRRYQFVGLVEPGTSGYGPIERMLRDYDLTAGLIDVTDAEGLRTLDVIYLGWNFSLPQGAAEAIASVVANGVGLYNEHLTAKVSHGYNDPRIRRLMLAESEVGFYHTTPCLQPRWATYHERHPAFPGIRPGAPMLVSGCGPIYKPVPDAKVLMTHNGVVSPNEPLCSMTVPPRHIPALVVGQIGLGRVIVLNVVNPDCIFRHPAFQGDYLANVFHWLADPCRGT